MPEKKPTPEALLSKELLLAAIERAERHQAREGIGVLLATVKEHLGLARGGWATRRLRPQLETLQAAGQIEPSRRHGLNLWGLTRNGHKRLQAARAAGQVGVLPESPQHRRWRQARTTATEQIAGFRGDLRDALAEATGLLEAGDQTPSDAWFEAGDRLEHACARLASATHITREWAEPDDAQADIDTHRRGRRNIRQYDH